MPSLRIAVPAGICALAALSLLAPYEPLYDAWAWLVWGRETAGLDLDTTAGPSWKPLPVVVTTVLSPAGDAAPALWLFVARAAGLAAVALAWKLASSLSIPAQQTARLSPRTVRRARLGAGLVAAAGLILLFDPFTSWTRQFAGGLSEPLLVALVLGAVDRALADRHGQALALGLAAALLRPEAWPLFGAYLLWTWRHRPELRRWIVAAAIGLPALWLVPDLLASGDALTGADRAREGTGSALPEAVEALGRAFELPLAALWVGAAACVAGAWRDREREILVLAGGAAAWLAIVAALSALGYAGLPRFFAPAAAIVCVLGAVGLLRLAVAAATGAEGRARPALALVVLLAAGIVVQGAVRAAEIPGELDRARAQGTAVDDLEAAVKGVAADSVVACPPPSITDFLFVPPLAWDLERSISEIEVRVATPPSAGYAFAGTEATPAGTALETTRTPVSRSGEWTVYRVSCVIN